MRIRALTQLIDTVARNGGRVTINGTRVFAGLGNRAGLHSYAETVIITGYTRGAPRLRRRCEKLVVGDVVALAEFRNITRDRGRWVVFRTEKATAR